MLLMYDTCCEWFNCIHILYKIKLWRATVFAYIFILLRYIEIQYRYLYAVYFAHWSWGFSYLSLDIFITSEQTSFKTWNPTKIIYSERVRLAVNVFCCYWWVIILIVRLISKFIFWLFCKYIYVGVICVIQFAVWKKM